MTAAIMEQTPLRRAAARANGINALCRELGVTRQAYYDWGKQGGATPVYAIIIARLTGVDPFEVCAERYHDQLVAIGDYYHQKYVANAQ